MGGYIGRGRHRALGRAEDRVVAGFAVALSATLLIGVTAAIATGSPADEATLHTEALAAQPVSRSGVRVATDTEIRHLRALNAPVPSTGVGDGLSAEEVAAASEEIQQQIETQRANDLAASLATIVATPAIAGRTMLYPVNARVGSPFGYRLHPIHRDHRLHTGVDFEAACGTPTVATRDGTVAFAGWMSGYGNRVEVRHGGGMVTTYSHLSVIGVRPGQQVGAGRPVGLVGTTGASTGCHLHFEVTLDGAYTDPMPFLSGKPSTAVITVPPAPTPTQSAGPTPGDPAPTTGPTASASPAPTPTRTPTRAPTPDPGESSTPGPSPSVEPTEDPTPEPSPQPTESPDPASASPPAADPSPAAP